MARPARERFARACATAMASVSSSPARRGASARLATGASTARWLTYARAAAPRVAVVCAGLAAARAPLVRATRVSPALRARQRFARPAAVATARAAKGSAGANLGTPAQRAAGGDASLIARGTASATGAALVCATRAGAALIALCPMTGRRCLSPLSHAPARTNVLPHCACGRRASPCADRSLAAALR